MKVAAAPVPLLVPGVDAFMVELRDCSVDERVIFLGVTHIMDSKSLENSVSTNDLENTTRRRKDEIAKAQTTRQQLHKGIPFTASCSPVEEFWPPWRCQNKLKKREEKKTNLQLSKNCIFCDGHDKASEHIAIAVYL